MPADYKRNPQLGRGFRLVVGLFRGGSEFAGLKRLLLLGAATGGRDCVGRLSVAIQMDEIPLSPTVRNSHRVVARAASALLDEHLTCFRVGMGDTQVTT